MYKNLKKKNIDRMDLKGLLLIVLMVFFCNILYIGEIKFKIIIEILFYVKCCVKL